MEKKNFTLAEKMLSCFRENIYFDIYKLHAIALFIHEYFYDLKLTDDVCDVYNCHDIDDMYSLMKIYGVEDATMIAQNANFGYVFAGGGVIPQHCTPINMKNMLEVLAEQAEGIDRRINYYLKEEKLPIETIQNRFPSLVIKKYISKMENDN